MTWFKPCKLYDDDDGDDDNDDLLLLEGEQFPEQSASLGEVQQMLVRLTRIELRFLNLLCLVLVTIPTELPRIPEQSNTYLLTYLLHGAESFLRS